MAGLSHQIEARRAAAAAVLKLLKPYHENLEIRDVLKLGAQSCVFLARLDGQKVVIKRYLDEGAAQTIDNLVKELAFLSAHFGTGDCQVNRVLHAFPALGLVILSFAQGPRLSDKIAASRGRNRQKLVTHSGRWLAKCTAPRKRETTFGPAYWVKQCTARDTNALAAEDIVLTVALVEHMRAQLPVLRGCDVVQAATHGDFVGINAHFHKGVITAVDVQGECWMAISREAARFLVWQTIHDPRDCPTQYGIGQDDLSAFLSTGVISQKERVTIFPFFVAEQLHSRFIDAYSQRRIRATTRAVIKAFLDDH